MNEQEINDLVKRLRKHAQFLHIKGDHYQANKCFEDAQLIEEVFKNAM